jgi:hypothetical protein
VVRKVLSVLIAFTLVFSGISVSAISIYCCGEWQGGIFCRTCSPRPTTEQLALEADLIITGFVVEVVMSFCFENPHTATVRVTEVLKGDAQVGEIIQIRATDLNMVSTGFMYEGYDYMMLLTESSNHIGFYESHLGFIELYSPFIQWNEEKITVVRNLFDPNVMTTSDALLILRAVAGLIELTDEQAERFGIDSAPATADALRILRIVAGL